MQILLEMDTGKLAEIAYDRSKWREVEDCIKDGVEEVLTTIFWSIEEITRKHNCKEFLAQLPVVTNATDMKKQ